MEQKECIFCSKVFFRKRQRFSWWNNAKFCSHKCEGKSRIGEIGRRLGIPQTGYQKQTLRNYRHSQDAKLKISLAAKGKIPWNKGKELSDETRLKIGKASLGNKYRLGWGGEMHGNWIKDRSLVKRQDERDSPLYKEWRKKIFERDGYKCMWCGESGKLNADHIFSWKDYPRLRLMLENGQTLCIECHKVKTISQLKGTTELIFSSKW